MASGDCPVRTARADPAYGMAAHCDAPGIRCPVTA